MKNSLPLRFFLFLLAASLCLAQSQANQDPSEKIPVMDGGAGPCSLDLTVNDSDGKPVYAATIKVHIAYGFAGVRRLDLEAGTNYHGKAKFMGLPSRVHRPPLEFKASKDSLSGVATLDPATDCNSTRTIALGKQPANP